MLAVRDETRPRQSGSRPRQRPLFAPPRRARAHAAQPARHDAQGAGPARESVERYLAQLEVGKGNCSIVLLRRIARAIGLPVTQLVHEGAEPPLDLVLLTQFLERLPPDMLVEARKLVTEHFSSPSEDRRRIALIAIRGGGKSTLGRLLAERLDVPFIELDREIERRSGANLSEIFDMFGQETFRRASRSARC